VNFIEEQHGTAVVHIAVLARLGDSRTNILDTGHHGGQRNEMRVG
jgi:hypothetical protein